MPQSRHKVTSDKKTTVRGQETAYTVDTLKLDRLDELLSCQELGTWIQSAEARLITSLEQNRTRNVTL